MRLWKRGVAAALSAALVLSLPGVDFYAAAAGESPAASEADLAASAADRSPVQIRAESPLDPADPAAASVVLDGENLDIQPAPFGNDLQEQLSSDGAAPSSFRGQSGDAPAQNPAPDPLAAGKAANTTRAAGDSRGIEDSSGNAASAMEQAQERQTSRGPENPSRWTGNGLRGFNRQGPSLELAAAAALGFGAPLGEETHREMGAGVPDGTGSSAPSPRPQSFTPGARYRGQGGPLSVAEGEGGYSDHLLVSAPAAIGEGARHKSAAYPLRLAGVLGGTAFGVWALREAAAWYAFQALSSGAAAFAPMMFLNTLDVVSVGAVLFSVAAAFWAYREIRFIKRVAKESPNVSQEEFERAKHQAIQKMGLAPGIKERFEALVKPYPGGAELGLSYGFTNRSGIYGQPGLARYPNRFLRFLRHEADHYFRDQMWAPYRPARHRWASAGRNFWEESRAQLSEFMPSGLQNRKLPALERILRKARYSLDLPGRYELLLLEPDSRSNDWADRSLYEALSAGKATVIGKDAGPSGSAETTAAIASFLNAGRKREERFRVIVASGDRLMAPSSLPLKDAMERLDRVRRMADRLRDEGSIDDSGDIEREVARRIRKGASAETAIEEAHSSLWHELAAQKLKNMDLIRALNGFYERLQDQGAVILHWDQPSPDIDTIAKLLEYWRGNDRGRFEVARVSTEGGGQAIVAFKNEPRVELWLDALPGHRLEWTNTRLNLADHPDLAAREILAQAGYTQDQIQLFIDKMDMEVKHVFGERITSRGPPLAMNRIFVSVPRRYAEALKRYSQKEGFPVRASQGGIRAHLVQSLPIQKVTLLQRFFGIRGKNLRLDSLDTGVDDSHSDFMTKQDKISAKAYTNEPPTIDYDKHGTFTFSEMLGIRGAAPEAGGVMRKVFSRDGGASDGDIMAALVDAYKEGADGINLSLGQEGEVGSPLAEFVSNLVSGQKNSRGESVFIVASNGNAGPLDMTGSEPATGEHAFAVAAATKSLDDGIPEVAWYSSRGFAIDNRWYIPRLVFKPEITAIGGDVTPGKDPFRLAVQAARSKYGEPSPSDTPDGDTRMAGTSMAAPFITALMGLIKQAVKTLMSPVRATIQFLKDKGPFAWRMTHMRAATDMRVPLGAQGSGFVHSLAALLLAANSFSGSPKHIAALRGRVLKSGLPEAEWRAAEAAAAGEGGIDWIRRIERLNELELSVYEGAKAAGDRVLEKFRSELRARLRTRAMEPDDNREASADSEVFAEKGDRTVQGRGKLDKRMRDKIGNEVYDAALKRFSAERTKALPEFVRGLADPVWLARMFAAFHLMNMKDPAAAEPLFQTAIGDADGRVRQAAFLALATASTESVDERLQRIAETQRDDAGQPYPVDVPIYAAYALLRRVSSPAKKAPGESLERIFAPIAQGFSNPDKAVRETVSWAAGQLGKQIPASVVELVAKRVSDEGERNHIRHVAAIAVAKIVFAGDPRTITNQTIRHMLKGSEQDPDLARDTSEFFAIAAKKEEIVARMRSKSLAPALRAFVERFRSESADKAQGDIARILAGILRMPVEPSRAPSSSGRARAARQLPFGRLNGRLISTIR